LAATVAAVFFAIDVARGWFKDADPVYAEWAVDSLIRGLGVAFIIVPLFRAMRGADATGRV